MYTHTKKNEFSVVRDYMYVNQLNRIYNKIPDRDWFSTHPFITSSPRDHVGIRLQVPDLNFFVIGYQ